MTRQDLFKCPKCRSIYGDNKLQLPCGHYVCSNCLPSLTECPICDKALDSANGIRSEDEYRFRIMIMKKIRNEEDIVEFLKALDEETNADLTPGYCKQCERYTDNLYVCTVCAQEADLLKTADNVWFLNFTSSDETKPFLKLKTLGMCRECANGTFRSHGGHDNMEFKQVSLFGKRTYLSNCADTLNEVAEKNNLEEMERYPEWKFLFQIRNFAIRINMQHYLSKILNLNRENPSSETLMDESQREKSRLTRTAEYLDSCLKERRVQFGLDIANKARSLLRGRIPEKVFREIERILRDIILMELEPTDISRIKEQLEEKNREFLRHPVDFEKRIEDQESEVIEAKVELDRLSDERVRLIKELVCAKENQALAEEKQTAIEANRQEASQKENRITNLFIDYTLCKLAVLEKKIRRVPELNEAEIRSVMKA